MHKPSPQAMKKMMMVKPQADSYEAQAPQQTSSSEEDSTPKTASSRRRNPSSGASSLSSSGAAGLFAEKKDAKPMPMNARRTVPLPKISRREKKPRSATMLRRTGSNTSQFSTDEVQSMDAGRSLLSMQSLEEEHEVQAPVSSVRVVKTGRESPLTHLSDDDILSREEEILKQHEQKMQQLERRMQLQIQEQQRQHAELQQALLEQSQQMANRSMDLQHVQSGVAYGGQQPVAVAPSAPIFMSQAIQPVQRRAQGPPPTNTQQPQQQQQQRQAPGQNPVQQQAPMQAPPVVQQQQGSNPQPPAQQAQQHLAQQQQMQAQMHQTQGQQQIQQQQPRQGQRLMQPPVVQQQQGQNQQPPVQTQQQQTQLQQPSQSQQQAQMHQGQNAPVQTQQQPPPVQHQKQGPTQLQTPQHQNPQQPPQQQQHAMQRQLQPNMGPPQGQSQSQLQQMQMQHPAQPPQGQAHAHSSQTQQQPMPQSQQRPTQLQQPNTQRQMQPQAPYGQMHNNNANQQGNRQQERQLQPGHGLQTGAPSGQVQGQGQQPPQQHPQQMHPTSARPRHASQGPNPPQPPRHTPVQQSQAQTNQTAPMVPPQQHPTATQQRAPTPSQRPQAGAQQHLGAGAFPQQQQQANQLPTQQSHGQGHPQLPNQQRFQQANMHRAQTPQAQNNQQGGHPPAQATNQQQHGLHSLQQSSSGQTRLPPQHSQQQLAGPNAQPQSLPQNNAAQGAQNAGPLQPGLQSTQGSSGQSRRPGESQRAMTPLAPQGDNADGHVTQQQTTMQQQQQQQQPYLNPQAHGQQQQQQPGHRQQQFRAPPPASPAPSQASQGQPMYQQNVPRSRQQHSQRPRTTSFDSHVSGISTVSGLSHNLPQFTPERRQAGFPGQVLQQYAVPQTPSTEAYSIPIRKESDSSDWLAELTTQTVQHQRGQTPNPGTPNTPQTPEQTQWLSNLTQTVQHQPVQSTAQSVPSTTQTQQQTEWLAALTTQTVQQQRVQNAAPQTPERTPASPPMIEKRAMPTSASSNPQGPLQPTNSARARALENLWSQAETNHSSLLGPSAAAQGAGQVKQISVPPESLVHSGGSASRLMPMDSERTHTSRASAGTGRSVHSVETQLHSNMPPRAGAPPQQAQTHVQSNIRSQANAVPYQANRDPLLQHAPSHQAPPHQAQTQIQSNWPSQTNSAPYEVNRNLQTVFSEDGFEGQAPLGSGGTPWGQANAAPSAHPGGHHGVVGAEDARMHPHPARKHGSVTSPHPGAFEPNRHHAGGNIQSQPSNDSQTPHWKKDDEEAGKNSRRSKSGATAAAGAAAAAGGTIAGGAAGGNSTAGNGGPPGGADSRQKAPPYGWYLILCLVILLFAGVGTVVALYFLTDVFGGDDPQPTLRPTPSPSSEATLEVTVEAMMPSTLAPTFASFGAPPSSVPPPLAPTVVDATAGQESLAPSFEGLPDESPATLDPNTTLPSAIDDDFFDGDGNLTDVGLDIGLIEIEENENITLSTNTTATNFTEPPAIVDEDDDDNDDEMPSIFTLITNRTVAPVIVEPTNITITPENNAWPANRTTESFSWQEVRTIVGFAPDAQAGSFLAANSDGTIIAVGSSVESQQPVVVYRILENSAVQQLGSPLPPPTKTSSAVSAAISGEGTVVAVGYDDGSVQAYGFVGIGENRTGEGEWELKGDEILQEGERINAKSTAVAMSANGVILVVCVLDGDTETLSVQPYLYSTTALSWEAVGGPILRRGRRDQATVQISANGIYMAFTSLYDSDDGVPIGSVETFKLHIYGGSDATSRGTFEFKDVSQLSVSLSVNGNTLAVTNEKISSVYGFDWIARAWDVQPGGTFLSGGSTVSLSYSGELLVIGSQNMVDTYEFIDDLWMRSRLQLEGDEQDEGFGSSVVVSGDATMLAVGAPFSDDPRMGDECGRIYLYDAVPAN